MTEKLLQYIWQFQHYNKSYLKTAAGEDLQIIHPGIHNTSQGPDFLNAQIKCGETMLAGSIELHVRASEWDRHGHTTDSNYKNCILHVVWENDKIPPLPFPVLELQSRVSNLLLAKYESLMENQLFIPCATQLHKVNDITFVSWKQRLMAERLQERAMVIAQMLEQTNNHWEEVFWRLLAGNFGIKVNKEAFTAIAISIPINILAKHRHNLLQTEALLMGQAGLLTGAFEDAYPQMLQREYQFLQKKYALKPIYIPVHFLRMRPANFPTIRLSQLAALVVKSNRLFSVIKENEEVKSVIALFDVTANDFWHYHYTFSETTEHKPKRLGRQMTENIVLNTVIPALYAYGWYHNAEEFKEKALRWAETIAAEQNNITKGFAALGVENKNAFDSQALIQLKNRYCNEKRCLECAVGNKILREM